MEEVLRTPPSSTSTVRVQTVLELYGSSFRDITHLDPPEPPTEECAIARGHSPRPSHDSALNAFAQLAAIRLGARRALISLLDGTRQHILAEATPSMSLRFDSPLDVSEQLWLGNVSVPRTWGICENILGIEPGLSQGGTVVINDLTQVDKFARREYVTSGPQNRFYAGVALLSTNGTVVGALSVYDDKPRDDPSPDDLWYLRDLAATIVQYLDTYAVREAYQHGEQLTRGLISFHDGGVNLRAHSSESQPKPTSSMPSLEPGNSMTPAGLKKTHAAADSGPVPTSSPSPDQHSSVTAMQESILPTNSRAMFERAANIMRATRDLDGVIILDASVAAAGQDFSPPNSEPVPMADWTTPFDSRYSSDAESVHSLVDEASAGLLQKKGAKKCHCLGFSTRQLSSVAGDRLQAEYSTIYETDLRQMLLAYPQGEVFVFDAAGEPIHPSSVHDSAGAGDELNEVVKDGREHRATRKTDDVIRSVAAMKTSLPTARSIAFIPFWDYERSRWFAGCLCWMNDPLRPLSARIDMAYFKIFGNAIMSELARLDRISSAQIRTTFTASLSHELRSPLHGILGALQFLHDTDIDSFQLSMLNTLTACGQTLLSTIDNLLDHTKADETKHNTSTKMLMNEGTIHLIAKPLPAHEMPPIPLDAAIDLALVTEETIEAMFSGLSFYVEPETDDKDTTSSSSKTASDTGSSTGAMERKSRFIVLDIPQKDDWYYCILAGPWRRILMNLFGNALKYSQSGSVTVSLRVTENSDKTGPHQRLVLTVADSGRGMSQEFLANGVFRPFMQERSHSNGMGLGLSIVRQIIESIGGKIKITSGSSGTQITLKLALMKPATTPKQVPSIYARVIPRLQGQSICILHGLHAEAEQNLYGEDTIKHRTLFVQALRVTLRDHFGMNVIETNEWRGHNTNIVICPEPSFAYLESIRTHRAVGEKAPITVFIAMDGVEAATLRSDTRIKNKESVLEIMTQPCGPRKIAKILSHCLDRFESPLENTIRTPVDVSDKTTTSGTDTPAPSTPASGDPLISADSLKHCSTSPFTSPLSNTPEPQIPQMPQIPQHLPVRIPNTEVTVPVEGGEGIVLITDDNPINRKLLAAFTKKNGLKYREAENGLEALTAYSEGTPRFDVILMDVSMPVMDGMTATRAIRDYEQDHHMKPATIIALTGLASASARLEAWSSGVDHFMTKPVNFAKLKNLLKGVGLEVSRSNVKKSGHEIKDI